MWSVCFEKTRAGEVVPLLCHPDAGASVSRSGSPVMRQATFMASKRPRSRMANFQRAHNGSIRASTLKGKAESSKMVFHSRKFHLSVGERVMGRNRKVK